MQKIYQIQETSQDLKPHYGSTIIFKESHRGTRKGLKYRWIASFDSRFPEIIFIHKHSMWNKYNDEKLVWMLTHVFSHEPIHQILYSEGLDHNIDFDRGRKQFLKKLNLSKEEEKEIREIL